MKLIFVLFAIIASPFAFSHATICAVDLRSGNYQNFDRDYDMIDANQNGGSMFRITLIQIINLNCRNLLLFLLNQDIIGFMMALAKIRWTSRRLRCATSTI